MSFGFQAAVREGAWRAFRSFALQEMRDAANRARAIDASLSRIGRFTILYATEEREPGYFAATERRVGMAVTSNTSMSKLMMAYIAVGGNPFDISLFSYPDEKVSLTFQGELTTTETTPYNGVSVPRGVDMAQDGTFDAGWLPNLKYLPRRLGGQEVIWPVARQVVSANDSIRSWMRQEIREKRNNIEARILKQFDLREQLLREKNEVIASAVGGTISDIPFLQNYHAASNRIQVLIQGLDEQFYAANPEGFLQEDVAQTVDRAFGRFKTLFENYPEEKWSAL